MSAITQLDAARPVLTEGPFFSAAWQASTASCAIVEAGHICAANSSFARLFGYENPNEIQGMALAQFVPGARFCTGQGDHSAGSFQERSCGYPDCEFRTRKSDGSPIHVEAFCSAFCVDGRNLLSISMSDISQRERRRVVRDSNERYRAIFDAAAIGIVQCTTDGRVVESNRAVEDLLGYSHEELRGKHFGEFTHPDDLATDQSLFDEMVAGRRDAYQIELRYKRKDAASGWVRLTVSLVRGPDRAPEFVIGMVEDITERKRAEQQLREAQKMEAIGRLVGGVAHDFNNLLTGIMLYCDLLLAGLGGNRRLRHHVEEIRMAGEHGAALVQQLMAVARQQVAEPKVLSFNEVVERMRELLARLIGENIDLVTHLDPELWPVKMDPAQAQQIILNLVLNARDAMPEGGRIQLQTCNLRNHGANPEHSIEFTVADNGCGMTAETRARLFEPFFTTKKPGQGNGLGLSTVYGIVTQQGGSIDVESEPTKGTRVRVRLPRAADEKPVEAVAPEAHQNTAGRTILLVEDNAAIRNAAGPVLRRSGYRVLEASSGQEAIQIFRENRCAIDLLLADLAMPGMSGREVANFLRQGCPGLRVLYISGYGHETGTQDQGILLFRKPFTGAALLEKVRQVLHEPDSQHEMSMRELK